MDKNNNVEEFPVPKSSPESVLDYLGDIAPEIDVMSCVVRTKDDKTFVVHTNMNGADITWLRFVFDQGFRP